jgi:hypothetical protein
MVDVAQLVRASVCGTEGRGFESHHLPFKIIPPRAGFSFLGHLTTERWRVHRGLHGGHRDLYLNSVFSV